MKLDFWRGSARKGGRLVTAGSLALALGLTSALAVAASACRGGKTVSPAACMNACEQTCPYTPDSVGDNDQYLECLEACETKCTR